MKQKYVSPHCVILTINDTTILDSSTTTPSVRVDGETLTLEEERKNAADADSKKMLWDSCFDEEI